MSQLVWSPKWAIFGAILVLFVALLSTNLFHRLHHLHSLDCGSCDVNRSGLSVVTHTPLVWVTGKIQRDGHLQHVFNVFERIGYKFGSASDFDVMWSHDYPFNTYREQLSKLKRNQKINHFPGSGFITSKVELARSNLKYVPPAFRIPDHVEELREYAAKYPDKMFVQKSNAHRNIKIKSVGDLDLSKNGTFVQEFVHNPLLIDGYKFDIGVYVVLTSVDPLRVYAYWGDVLLRFCPEKYHPFNSSVLDKYVVGDNYLPVWKIASLKNYYDKLKLGHRESLNAHIADTGLDASKIWRQVDAAIREVYVSKEAAIKRTVSARYSRQSMHGHFFELVRFDFLVDELLNVYLLEANMSPNLSSRHFNENRLLYEQVIYSVLSVAGVGSRLSAPLHRLHTGPTAEMQLAAQQLAVNGQLCGSSACDLADNSSSAAICSGVCRLCVPCLNSVDRRILTDAASEHLNRHLCRRLLPPTSATEEDSGVDYSQMTPNNRLLQDWFNAKCLADRSWC